MLNLNPVRDLILKNVSVKLTARDSVMGRTIKVSIPHSRVDVPLFVLFRALGVISDKEILKYIVYDINDPENYELINWLKPSVEDGCTIMTQNEAIEFLLKNGSILGQPRDIKLSKEKKL